MTKHSTVSGGGPLHFSSSSFQAAFCRRGTQQELKRFIY